MADAPWLIVGLGNPGPTYAGNRHNVGFFVVEELAARLRGRFAAHKARADVVEARLVGIDAPRLVLAKPRSYMNESGVPVAGLASYYKVPVEQVICIHDELDLPFGNLRLKLGGGDNGHNGLRSLRRSLNSGDFYRVRCGIGRPPGRMDPADYVLRDFSAAESKEVPLLVAQAADAVETLVQAGLDRAQQEFNS